MQVPLLVRLLDTALVKLMVIGQLVMNTCGSKVCIPVGLLRLMKEYENIMNDTMAISPHSPLFMSVFYRV
jgi:hypothetical protein